MIPLGLDEIAGVMDAQSSGPIPATAVTEVCIDSRESGSGHLFFALPGSRTDGHEFVDDAFDRGAFGCVVSRAVQSRYAGVPGRAILTVPDVLAALGQLAAFHRQQVAATVIAVTGSNGKTTVRTLIDHVLSTKLTGRSSIKSFNNEIGLPLTLLSSSIGDDYLVAEVGANAPGEIAALAGMASPHIVVLTSVGEAHLAGFGSVEGVVREKMSLLDSLRPGGCAVINIDHPLVRKYLAQHHFPNVVTFGTDPSADIRITDVEPAASGVRFRLNGRFPIDLPLFGVHNAVNAAAAFAVCRRMKLEEDEIATALRTVTAPPGRMNVRHLDSLTVLDDCYNANPASMRAALDVLRSWPAARRVAIVGDMLELGEQTVPLHEELGRQLAEAGIHWIVAVGKQARSVVVGARSAGCGIQADSVSDADETARLIPSQLQANDTVLIKGSRGVALETVVAAIQQQRRGGASPVDRSLIAEVNVAPYQPASTASVWVAACPT